MIAHVPHAAEVWRYVAFNDAMQVRMLEPVSRDDVPLDHAVLTPPEITTLLGATDPDWRAAIGVLAFGGLRLGEFLGLQRGDAEFE
jgi:integrase